MTSAGPARGVEIRFQRTPAAHLDRSLHTMHRRAIAFGRICGAAREDVEGLCRLLLPRGERDGGRWVSPLPTGLRQGAGRISVNLTSGRWINHTTGGQGDSLIKLAAFVWRIDRWQAALRLAERLGVDPFR